MHGVVGKYIKSSSTNLFVWYNFRLERFKTDTVERNWLQKSLDLIKQFNPEVMNFRRALVYFLLGSTAF